MPYQPFPYVIFLFGFPMIRCKPIPLRFSRVREQICMSVAAKRITDRSSMSFEGKNSKGKTLTLIFFLHELIPNS